MVIAGRRGGPCRSSSRRLVIVIDLQLECDGEVESGGRAAVCRCDVCGFRGVR